MRYRLLALLTLSVLSLSPAQADTDAALSERLQAAVLAGGCAGCHGTNGNLSGFSLRDASSLEEQLLNFKYDRTPASVMNRIAKGYSDDELAIIAQFFTTLEGAE